MPDRSPVFGWGDSILREIAAKQQMLPTRHLFADEASDAQLAELGDLIDAMAAVTSGAVNGQGLRDVLLCPGPLDRTADLLRTALGPGCDEFNNSAAGAALGLAFVPIEWVDTLARHLLSPLGLKSIAKGIDARGDLVLRTRLFMADRLLKEASLETLVKGVSAMVLLRENGPNRLWPELAHPSHRDRLTRITRLVTILQQDPQRLIYTLSECLRTYWKAAEHRLREAMPDEPVGPGTPPLLADLFAICVLPNCETVDAVSRMRRGEIVADLVEERFIAS